LPHAFVSSVKSDIKPCSVGELKLIEFFRTTRYSLAFIEMRGVRFALSVRGKEGNYLIKPEKLTRPSELNLTKEAIAIFCDAFCGELISSNVALKKEKPKSSKLLDPLFFCEHPEFFDGEVAVEVGFGSGRHLLYRAKEEPHKKFVGIEIYKPSIEQVLRQCELQGLENVYVVDFDARLVIETMKEGAVSEIFVHFPVPWPDSPTRRVISESFLGVCSKVLKEGGFVELRSDDREYFEYSFGCAMSLPKTRVDTYKNEPAEIVSKYEDRWLRQGKDIFEMRVYPEKSENSEQQKASFEFEGEVSFQAVQNLPKGAMVNEGMLLNFEDLLLSSNGKDFALKVTFGDTARPDRRYIVSLDGTVSYFPFAPLCVEASRKAHKIIKEYLYGKNS
jgi:tRNA (guanine-N7-)-methyltransferase